MANESAFFATKSIGLSTYGGRTPCSLEIAARHNLREIQAEQGARSHIDASRIKNNVVLSGPRTAREVQVQAGAMLAIAKIDASKLRRDHCQAIEVLFSLSPNATLDTVAFFRRCLDWITAEMRLPVLSAVVHLDEAAPHAHVLLLPMRGDQHVGNKPIARAALRALRESFFASVAGPAGLKRPGAKMTGMVKRLAVAAALSACKAQGIPEMLGVMWPVLSAAIECDPTPTVRAMQISDEEIRTSIWVKEKPMGFDSKPMGFQEVDAKTKTYPCVGFVQPTTSPPPQKAVESLSELWERIGNKILISSSIGPRIGPRLMCNKRKRLAVPREALRNVMGKSDKLAAGDAGNEPDVIRLRDADTHYPSARDD